METDANKDPTSNSENQILKNEGNEETITIPIISNLPQTTKETHKPQIKPNEIQPSKQTIISLSNLFEIYQPFRENQNQISPEEISLLSRMPYLKSVDKDLGGNLFSCFQTVSNSPVTWDVAQQSQSISRFPKDLKENSPYPKSAESHQSHQNSTTTSTTSTGKRKYTKHNQNSALTLRQLNRLKQKSESPQQKFHFVDYSKPINKPYAPWSDIVSSTSKNRRSPYPIPTMQIDDAQETIVNTFHEIKEIKPKKEPDLVLSALHKNPALVLALGPPFPILETDKEILTKREKTKIKEKEKYAITLLPINRKQSIPPHRILKKIYIAARNDSFETHDTIQLFLNRVYLSEKYSKSISITPFNRVCRYLWPVRRQRKTSLRGQKHQRQVVIEEENIGENSINYDNVFDVMATMSTDTYAVKNHVAANTLNIVFDTPFELDYLKLKNYFEKKNE